MKKIFALVAVLLASSCSIYSFLNELHSYSIDFYDQNPVLVNSEQISERTQPYNEVLTAYVGYSVIDRKVYNKSTYATEILRANKGGIVEGLGTKSTFKRGETKEVLGMAYLSDGNYMLITTDIPNYVLLVRQDGTLHKNIGAIKNGRLVLTDGDTFTSPRDFKFELVTTSKSEQTNPEKGFDIKYNGIKLDRMVFTYLDYSKNVGKNGYFEDITFPMNQELIEIEGATFKVLRATKDKIDYVILK